MMCCHKAAEQDYAKAQDTLSISHALGLDDIKRAYMWSNIVAVNGR